MLQTKHQIILEKSKSNILISGEKIKLNHPSGIIHVETELIFYIVKDIYFCSRLNALFGINEHDVLCMGYGFHLKGMKTLNHPFRCWFRIFFIRLFLFQKCKCEQNPE